MINSYDTATQFLGSKQARRIPNKRSTSVVRLSDTSVAVRYHWTDVVTFHADGRIVLNSNGHQSVTTKARFSQHVPYRVAQVFQRDFSWYVTTDGSHDNRVPYRDGMTFLAQ